MKKALSIILCAAFLMVMLIGAVNAAVAGDDPKNQVKVAKGTAVIDGNMDDCYKASGKITTPYPNDAVEGTNFATFEGYAVYDADAFYLWGHVSDPTLSANSGDGGGSGWNGDSIEIFFNYNLDDGVGATDETDTYGDTGCMQFRIIPLPIEDLLDNSFGGKYENSSGHGLDDEVTEDVGKNPKNYLCTVDADKKGYTIECRFPLPSAKKASVKPNYAIGFSIQVNDAQDGTPTEDARRTGTIHFQDGEQMEQCWQYAGAMGRAIFTDDAYAAPDAPSTSTDAPATPAAAPGGAYKDIKIGGGATTINAVDFDSGTYFESNASDGSHDIRPDEDIQTEVGGSEFGGNIGWTAAGEWVQYTVNVESAGRYKFEVWLASDADPTGGLALYCDGAAIGTSDGPPKDGWQSYTLMPVGEIDMSAGTHVIKAEWPNGNNNLSAIIVTNVPVAVASPNSAPTGDTTIIFVLTAILAVGIVLTVKVSKKAVK